MTDQQLEELVKKDLKLAEENNRILKKMYHSIQWGRFFRLLYWAAIIVMGFGSYYLIQPYIGALQELSEILPGASTNLKNVGNSLNDINSLLKP